MYTILVASLNENVKLANTLKIQLNDLDEKCEIINLIELDLPMYSSKKEEAGISNEILELVTKLESSQGYIVIAPEYNFSIPPVLTNTVAWISRVDEDFKKYFSQKDILLASHSGGAGNDVLRDMRNQFEKLGAKVFHDEILITYKKPLNKEYTKQTLESYLTVSSK